ncbi:MAG: molybdopterin-dependent oxidoreductase [Pseudomonadota bacterium]
MSTQPLRRSPAVCPLDCPDTCSLTVTHTPDTIVSLQGSKGNPFTGGRICAKVRRHYPEFTHGDNRLREPLRAVGSKGDCRFEPITWDEALDLAHAGLARVIEQHGPEAVVPFNYAGPHGMLADGSMDRRFLHRLGASLVDRGALCGNIKSLAWSSLYGAMPGMGPEQAEHAQVIVVWSNNVTVSNLHLARVIQTARKRGARLVVIDPKRIRIAANADLHIAPKPGTDVVLGYALATELERLGAFNEVFIDRWVLGFEPYMAQARRYPAEVAARICDVPVEQIRTLARWYAEARAVALSVGNGMERSRTGGASLRTAMALPALTGNFGDIGNGVIAKVGNAFPKTPQRLQRTDWIPAGTRTVNILSVPEHILDDTLAPPVRGLIIYNHNPIATHPDQHRMLRALQHPDLFTVGIEVAMTDSMRYADVILPAAGPFEIDDIYGAYGQQYLQRARPIIRPVGEARANTWIFQQLAKRFGFDDPAFDATDLELMDDALDLQAPAMNGAQPSTLPIGTALHMTLDGEPIVPFENVFPATPSGKVELYSADLERRFGAGLPAYEPADTGVPDAYPLQLLTPSSAERTNATFGGVSANLVPEVIELHPVDAEHRGLNDGDRVKVYNALGDCELIVRVTDATRPGLAYSPKGTWLATSHTGQTVNALVPDLRSDIADGACFNNTFVQVAPLRKR